jgi:ubiquinol-cytochrome c reductase cytochrome b subunit
MPQKNGIGRIVDWLDQRTDIRRLTRWLLDEPIPGGARWAYVFGSGLLCAVALQAATGIALALYYVPAAVSAHATVAYITKQVWSGSFIRSAHAYGTHVIVLLVAAHLIQTFVYGAFKRRREVLWLSGVCLLLLLLGMAFTGSLLPWDQRAYAATVVGTSVIGEAPLVGPAMKRLLRGGDEMGTLTLSRFYVLHVIILPLGILTLIALHVCLFRKAGPAGPARVEANVVPKTQPFYPRQLLMDVAFGAVILLAIAALAHFAPVTLGPEADPSNTRYLPRPEWYFLPLFQWLKYWQPPYTVIGVVVIPALVLLALASVPFFDRSAERQARGRPVLVVAFFSGLVAVFSLGALSRVDDRSDSVVHAQLVQQESEVRRYMKLPFRPLATLPADGASSTDSSQIAAGKRIFEDHHCYFCHGDGAVGTAAAPSLIGIGEQLSTDEVMALVKKPNAKMSAGKMPAFDGTDEELRNLIAYLKSLE